MCEFRVANDCLEIFFWNTFPYYITEVFLFTILLSVSIAILFLSGVINPDDDDEVWSSVYQTSRNKEKNLEGR